MSTPKVTIIVPVHNAGVRFSRCLDTLINQSLQELEIVLVIDCPSDGSDKIAQQYAISDSRVKLLVNETNLNIGLTRNRGLEIATGEYVGFSDHDDFREEEMYEKLYSVAVSQQADLVIGLPVKLHTARTESYSLDFLDNVPNLKYALLEDLLLCGVNGMYNPSVTYIHPNLYRRSFLIDNNIKFVDNREISAEDYLFQMESVFHSQKTVIDKHPFYYHVIHKDSVGHEYAYRSYNKRIATFDYSYNFLQREGVFDEYRNMFESGVRKAFMRILLSTLLEAKSIKEFSRAKRAILSTPYAASAFKGYAAPQEVKNPISRFVRTLIARQIK